MEISTQWLLIGLVAIVVIAAGVLFVLRAARKRRHRELRWRFGDEYDRAVERQRGDVARAESELVARKKRVERLHLRHLSEADRARFAASWQQLQKGFVDDPASAIAQADDLIQAVMRARGYWSEGYEQRVADLSVDHAGSVQHYRAAHELAAANREGRASTEELRQAVVHYRALFAELLERVPTTTETPTSHEVHA